MKRLHEYRRDIIGKKEPYSVSTEFLVMENMLNDIAAIIDSFGLTLPPARSIHPVQLKMIELSKTMDISTMKLRELGKLVGVKHPQSVKDHRNRVIRNFLTKT